ncbi:MAG: zf-TFIIB domain-containing protein, partial [Candidatus Omnitrophica bacterium]|nr:zf-TFIIB domain-containing protein [Candidatus Omnitrophota bacterium]
MDQKIAKEDEFFHQHNQKLIEERRKKIDAKRAEEEKELRKNTHWMKCPKCGHDMEEVNIENILVDKCTECEGLFFDRDEVDTLIEVRGK